MRRMFDCVKLASRIYKQGGVEYSPIILCLACIIRRFSYCRLFAMSNNATQSSLRHVSVALREESLLARANCIYALFTFIHLYK